MHMGVHRFCEVCEGVCRSVGTTAKVLGQEGSLGHRVYPQHSCATAVTKES